MSTRIIGIGQYLTVGLLLLLSLLFAHDGFTWALECVWVIVGLALCLWLNARGVRPTGLLSWGLVIHALILIYGAWYTYEKVPLGFWMSDVFGWERNHYDRIGHLAQGFFPALLIREVLVRHAVVNGRAWREGLTFACLMAFTGIFELIEFGAAMAFGGGADAYLGSQGDIWDAQWDMLMCAIGGAASIILLRRWHERQIAGLRCA